MFTASVPQLRMLLISKKQCCLVNTHKTLLYSPQEYCVLVVLVLSCHVLSMLLMA